VYPLHLYSAPSIACLENIGVVLEAKEEGLKEAIEIVKELNNKIGINGSQSKRILQNKQLLN